MDIISRKINLSQSEIKDIYDIFMSSFKARIDVTTITDALVTLMGIVGKIDKLSGIEKKELTIGLLLHIVNETDSGKYDEIIDKILINLIPILIDRLVSVEKGKLVFNKKTFSCLPCVK
jgi:hypothetical protein